MTALSEETQHSHHIKPHSEKHYIHRIYLWADGSDADLTVSRAGVKKSLAQWFRPTCGSWTPKFSKAFL